MQISVTEVLSTVKGQRFQGAPVLGQKEGPHQTEGLVLGVRVPEIPLRSVGGASQPTPRPVRILSLALAISKSKDDTFVL